MSRRDVFGRAVKTKFQDINLRDDFELDELEEEEKITVYDIDPVLGFTADVFLIGVPLLCLGGLFLGLIWMFGTYL
jgi:hypothetical protein